jgi:katanin p60 ATPase-containing subunit A1
MNKIFEETEAKMGEEKKIQERRKNIIVLIQKYLLNLGYLDTINKLQAESTISLDKWL